jgi:hypothetical protein
VAAVGVQQEAGRHHRREEFYPIRFKHRYVNSRVGHHPCVGGVALGTWMTEILPWNCSQFGPTEVTVNAYEET